MAPTTTTAADIAVPDHAHPSLLALSLGAVGVVYGDIGTSPLYALREALHHAAGDGLDRAEVLGVVSLLLWALIVIVTIKYVLLLVRLDNQGEGGTLSLLALFQAALGRRTTLVLGLAIAGTALFFADAAITPGDLGPLRGRGPEARHAGVRPLRRAAHARDPGGPLRRPEPRHGVGGAVVRADHGASGSSPWRWLACVHIGDDPGRAGRLRPAPRALVPRRPRPRRLRRARLGVPGGHRRRGALRRHGPLRPRADPARLARARLPGPVAELPGPGRARARPAGGAREPVLPPGPGLGAAADGAPRHGRHRDREPGRDHGRLLGDPPGGPARAPAALRGLPHLGRPWRAGLPAAGEPAAPRRRAPAGAAVPELERARLRLRHRGDRGDDHRHRAGPARAAPRSRVGHSRRRRSSWRPSSPSRPPSSAPTCSSSTTAATCRCCWPPGSRW